MLGSMQTESIKDRRDKTIALPTFEVLHLPGECRGVADDHEHKAHNGSLCDSLRALGKEAHMMLEVVRKNKIHF